MLQIKSHRSSQRGNTLLLSLLAIGVLLLVGGNAVRLATNRLASVSQSSSWQKAYFLAEAGVDIGRNTLKTASVDSTIWGTQTFPSAAGVSTGWSSADPATFPKTAVITLPALAESGSQVSTIRLVIDRPTGAGTINPAGTGLDRAYRIRSFGNVGLPGPVRVSRDSTESNLRKIGWIYDWRSGQLASADGNGPRATRTLEVVVRPVTPFVAAIIADNTIEMKKGSEKLVDSWNSQNPDVKERKYMKPSDDKFKGAQDVGNIAANGISDKKKKVKDVIRLEGMVVWGDVYASDASKVNIKPAPKVLTDVIKGGDIIDDFYMKLDPVPALKGNPDWAAPTATYKVNPGSAKIPLLIPTGSDPNNPPKIKFTELHLHTDDQVVFLPSVDADGIVQPASYVDIWVANSMRIHKGGTVRLGQGVNVRVFVDKCIHLESKSSAGGFQYAEFELTGSDKFKTKAGVPIYAKMTVKDAVEDEFATATQLQIYGALAKKKRSHVKLSAETLGMMYAPRHDFKVKLKDSSYSNLYGSYIGRKFKIEGKTKFHYDENLAGKGIATDYGIISMVEDWYDRSGGK